MLRIKNEVPVIILATVLLCLSSCGRQLSRQKAESEHDVNKMSEASTASDSLLVYGKVIQSTDEVHTVDSVQVKYNNASIAAALVLNGSFELKIPKSMIGKQVFGVLYDKPSEDPVSFSLNTIGSFIVEQEAMHLVFDKNLKEMMVRGGIQSMANDLYTTTEKIWSIKKKALKEKKTNGVISPEAYKEQNEALNAEIENDKIQFIKKYPYAYNSLHLLEAMVQNYMHITWVDSLPLGGEPLQLYKDLFFSLERLVQEKGQSVLAMIQNMEARRVPTFTGEMPDGSTFDLADLKGKVVLIDFWGSWCGWCRKAHPHLKELYAKYKDKGFEIVGVGVEHLGKTREEKWQKFKTAIADDGVTWPQILVDKNKRDIPLEYGVTTFPSTFLVDRDGRLLLRVGTDTDRIIDAKLAELFAEDSSAIDREKEKYLAEVSDINVKIQEIGKNLGASLRDTSSASEEKGMAILREMSKLKRERLTKHADFVSAHPDLPYSLEVLKKNCSAFINQGNSAFMEMQALYYGLSENVRAQDTAQFVLGDYIQNYSHTKEGEMFEPFSFVNHDGREIDMADLKGKVILLDFWGSWCVWCRKLTPHLKDLYSEYKDEGLVIVGVALENGTKEAQIKKWKRAIEEDSTPWLHVLNDLDGRNLVEEYAIKSYPTIVLIDKKGQIVSRGKNFATLEEQIVELIKS